MTKNVYVIQDWAGNELLHGKTFASFEEGWEFIYSELTDKLDLQEDDYQEYYVVPKGVADGY